MDENLSALGVSGHADPDGESPWAMQLVVRAEKATPPTATPVLEAAAMAVVRLLADPRSQADGEWYPQVQRWLAGRIRKIVRRARASAWERAAALGGVTVSHHGVEVRAFVPGPTDAVAPELSKLQLSGLGFADPERRSHHDDASWPGLVVAVNPAVEASLGKMAAQTGHAANVAWLEMEPARRAAWAELGYPVVVIHPDASGWEAFSARASVQITDAGFTEVAPGTHTTAAL